MPKLPIGWSLALLGVAALARPAVAQQPKKMVRLTGTNSVEIAKAKVMGPVDQNEQVEFAFTLPVQKQAELDDYLKRLYTPGDPLYRQYLLKDEFASLFGPTQAQYDAVIAYAERSGLKVVSKHSNRLVLNVAGPSAKVEKALAVHLMRFRSPAGRVFHAPDQEPSVPADVAPLLAGIVGLDKSVEPKSNLMRSPRAGEPVAASGASVIPGHGPLGGYSPADLKAAYNLNGLIQDGTGQTVGLFELDGFYNSDITGYDDQFGLAHGTVNVVTVGTPSFPTQPTMATPDPSSVIECELDIEMVKALAPGATIIAYEGTDYVSLYNKIASDDVAQQVSTSWYYDTDAKTPAALRNGENTAFQQMAAQGQSLYGATGDYGDQVKEVDSKGNVTYTFGVQDPSSQPFITAVGGTTLVVDATTAAYTSETAWTGDASINGGGSTGGISTIWPLPIYQPLAISPNSGGSSTFRNLPDVALNSDPSPGYSIYRTSGYPTKSASWIREGGTSAASPLWAAYTALVNQYRAGIGAGKLGFPNPTIYFVAHLHYATDFHDIISGNNVTYYAVPGYDNVTGWGSFDGGALFTDLTRDASILHVDVNYTGGVANGSPTTPFKKIGDALNAASASLPTLIYVRGGAYNETFTTSKPVLIVNDGNGNVTFGSSTVH